MSVSSPTHPNDLSTDTDGFSEPDRNTRTTPSSSHPVDYSSTADLGSSPESVLAIPSLPASRRTDRSTSSSASSSLNQPYNVNTYSHSAELERDREPGTNLSRSPTDSSTSADGFPSGWIPSDSEQSVTPLSSIESSFKSSKPCHIEVQTDNLDCETPSGENDVFQNWAESVFQERTQIDSERQPLLGNNEEIEMAEMTGRMNYSPSGDFALYCNEKKKYFITTRKPPVPRADDEEAEMKCLSKCKKTFFTIVDAAVWVFMGIAFLATALNDIALMAHIFYAGLEPSDRSLVHDHLYCFIAFGGLVLVGSFLRRILSVWQMIWCLRSLQNKQEVLCCWLKFWEYDEVVYVPRSTRADFKAVGEYLELMLIDTKPSAECLAILLKILIFLYLPIFVMFEVIITYNI